MFREKRTAIKSPIKIDPHSVSRYYPNTTIGQTYTTICMPSRDNLSISESLDGSVIFLTGATGYLGSLILEQLLRTCPGESDDEGERGFNHE